MGAKLGRLRRKGMAGAPQISPLLCGPSTCILQHSGFRVARLLMWWASIPKVQVQKENEGTRHNRWKLCGLLIVLTEVKFI